MNCKIKYGAHLQKISNINANKVGNGDDKIFRAYASVPQKCQV